jgi:hypothetical protein
MNDVQWMSLTEETVLSDSCFLISSRSISLLGPTAHLRLNDMVHVRGAAVNPDIDIVKGPIVIIKMIYQWLRVSTDGFAGPFLDSLAPLFLLFGGILADNKVYQIVRKHGLSVLTSFGLVGMDGSPGRGVSERIAWRSVGSTLNVILWRGECSDSSASRSTMTKYQSPGVWY